MWPGMDEEGELEFCKNSVERNPTSTDEEGDEDAEEGVKIIEDIIPGVIYISRIPPFMKPHKLKHLLSPYGSIGRLYLKPEGKRLIYLFQLTTFYLK